MNPPKSSPEQAPGHYGAGYGEQVPDDAPPQPAPKTDSDAEPVTPAATGPVAGSASESSPATGRDDGVPVVFTPDDVGARPPDHPPTESAPESEKAALIFERS
jgi:hypothetical protein